jgi:hypothetical protein
MAEKVFETLDMVRFALPNVRNIDVLKTAKNPKLLDRLSSKGFGSYAPMWPRMREIWRGGIKEKELERCWKTKWRIEAMLLLAEQYSAEGRWYPLPQSPKNIMGMQLKSSARGILFTKAFGPEVHVINPRKDQVLTRDDLSFLARATYEEYCVDDPSNPKPVIIDLSSRDGSKKRFPVIYREDSYKMMSVNEFESIATRFFEAVAIAGFDVPRIEDELTADLFRRYR